MPAAEPKLRLAIVGTGDVAYRHYLPALEDLADAGRHHGVRGPAAGCRRTRGGERRRLVARGGAVHRSRRDAGRRRRRGGHRPGPRRPSTDRSTRPILEAGLHLYSEKPLAGSVAEADRLIATAAERGVRFLCAPGVAVTSPLPLAGRAHRLGALRPAHAGGDPPRGSRPGRVARVHRRPDTVLSARASARSSTTACIACTRSRCCSARSRGSRRSGTIATPTRVVRGGPLTGRTIEVTTPDHVLINLQFANGALGQLLASFGTPSSLAPWLELHFPMATLSFSGPGYDDDDPVSLYVDDDGPDAREGWQHGIEIPKDGFGIVEAGRAPLHRLPARRGRARPDGRARPPRPRGHARGLCLDRRRTFPRDRHDLLIGRCGAALAMRAQSRTTQGS